jgi:hypothetical protein
MSLLACCSTAALRANNIRNASAGTFTEAIERHQDETARRGSQVQAAESGSQAVALAVPRISIARPKKLGHRYAKGDPMSSNSRPRASEARALSI